MQPFLPSLRAAPVPYPNFKLMEEQDGSMITQELERSSWQICSIASLRNT